MASFRERGKRIQARVHVKGQAEAVKTFPDLKTAKAWAVVTEAAMLRGDFIPASRQSSVLLRDVLTRYQLEVSARKRGGYVEHLRIEAFKRLPLAGRNIRDVKRGDIAAYRESRLAAGVSGATVAREMVLLAHVFSTACNDWGLVSVNVAACVAKPRQSPHRERTLSGKERTDLLRALEHAGNPWVKPVVVFALGTACRRGEILSLQWKDVNVFRRVAKVSGKTGARAIPLSSDICAMLSNLPRSLTGYVFPITARELRAGYEKALRQAGIVDFTFHDLRHDALTRMADAGLSVLELRAISGHASADQLKRYVAIDPSRLARKLM
jgi:integrase